MKVDIGCRYGRLVVVELVKDRKNPKAICACDCGNRTVTQRGALKNGRAKSCGCLRDDGFIERNTTHGLSKSDLYSVWRGIKSRCLNKKNPAYKNYGGRGISIDERWMEFDNFHKDMSPRPAGAMIERKDTNGPYSKENCIWSGWDEQSINKRSSRRWLINGVEYKSSVDAASAIGVDASTINKRTNGRMHKGVWYPPKEGYSSYLVYGECE